MKKVTQRKLKMLDKDPEKQIYGVFYTNSLLSQRYVSRTATAYVDFGKNEFKQEVGISLAMRLETAGLTEMESTLDVLARNQAGDLPGATPEGYYEREGGDIHKGIPELLSTQAGLSTVDLFVRFKDPSYEAEDFTIQGNTFTKVKIEETVEEGFDHSVTLIYGKEGRMSILSFFKDKVLDKRDTRSVLGLIADNNYTGREVTSVRVFDKITETAMVLYPQKALLPILTGLSTKDRELYMIGDHGGNITFCLDHLKEVNLTCKTVGKKGWYDLIIDSKYTRITITLDA
jgi:hypothetical protein